MNNAPYWMAVSLFFATRMAFGQDTFDSIPPVQANRLVDVDQMFANLESHGISAAACTIVKDDRVVHSQGYGVENRSSGKPVDPESTRFYLASVTKALTATIIMRLVDRGELNLDEDIRMYLGNEPQLSLLPDSPPITLRHLLTHSAGLDDRNIGMAAASRRDLVALSDYLSRALPSQVRCAGEITMYDNHGWALAGLIAERVTNTPYPELLERELFSPLGMKGSLTLNSVSIEEPVALAEAYVTRFENDQMVWKKVGRSYRQTSPAGSVWSTADDMTRFVRMHLNMGKLDGVQFMSEGASRQMQSISWESQPESDGLTAGFWERRMNGHRVLMIMGEAPEGASIIALVPQKKLGVFLTASRNDLSFLTPILQKILAKHAPGTQPDVSAAMIPNWDERSKHLAGEYYLLRFSQQSLETLAKWQAWIRVELVEAGKIRVTDSMGETREYQESSHHVYRQVGKPGFISFKSNSDGKALWATTTDGLGFGDGMGFLNSFQKARWFERVNVKRSVLLGSLLVFAFAIIAWPLLHVAFAVFLRFKRGTPPEKTRRIKIRPRWGRSLAWLMATSGLTGLFGVALLFANQDQLVIGMPTWGQIPCWLLLVFVLLVPVCLWQTIIAWKQKSWSIFERLIVSTVTITAMTLIPFLWQWNLIRLSF